MARHSVTLFIANKKVNELMQHFDLRPDHKQFIETVKASFERAEPLTSEFFLDIIEKSKKDKDYWIPVIQFGDVIYKDASVKELSDGNNVMFP
jgi:hypothetical protein